MIELFPAIITPIFFGVLIWLGQPKKCKRCKELVGRCVCLPF